MTELRGPITARDIVDAIDWMGGMNAEVVELNGANWSTVDEDGKVKVEGWAYIDGGRHFVEATFVLTEATATYWGEGGDDD